MLATNEGKKWTTERLLILISKLRITIYLIKGIRCDKCLEWNFVGNRFKCLVCEDFDLCNECREKFTTTPNNNSLTESTNLQDANNHSHTHPMQITLTHLDFESFHSNYDVYFMNKSFTCPYCVDSSFDVNSLCKHLASTHSQTRFSFDSLSSNLPVFLKENVPQKVSCPICVALSVNNAGNEMFLMQDLLQHINMMHLFNRSLNSQFSNKQHANVKAANNQSFHNQSLNNQSLNNHSLNISTTAINSKFFFLFLDF